jgi:hypothetical protein
MRCLRQNVKAVTSHWTRSILFGFVIKGQIRPLSYLHNSNRVTGFFPHLWKNATENAIGVSTGRDRLHNLLTTGDTVCHWFSAWIIQRELIQCMIFPFWINNIDSDFSRESPLGGLKPKHFQLLKRNRNLQSVKLDVNKFPDGNVTLWQAWLTKWVLLTLELSYWQ